MSPYTSNLNCEFGYEYDEELFSKEAFNELSKEFKILSKELKILETGHETLRVMSASLKYENTNLAQVNERLISKNYSLGEVNKMHNSKLEEPHAELSKIKK